MLKNKNLFWILPTVIVVIAALAVVGLNQDNNQTKPGKKNINESLSEFYKSIYEQYDQMIVSVKSKVTVRNCNTKEATGFFINEKGYVLTAYDNVLTEKAAFVQTINGLMEMNVFKTDSKNGWAILKPKEPTKTIKYAKFSQSKNYQIADACFVMSNSLNSVSLAGKPTFKSTNISRINKKTDNPSELIEIGCKIDDASIGSPLLDVNGHVIGMCVGYENAGRWLIMAIPTDVFKNEINDIK